MANSTVSTVASNNSTRLIKKPDLLPSPIPHSPSESMCPSPKVVKGGGTGSDGNNQFASSGETNSRIHLHRKGSRLINGVNYYRAHAASRRAVIKMLGKCDKKKKDQLLYFVLFFHSLLIMSTIRRMYILLAHFYM